MVWEVPRSRFGDICLGQTVTEYQEATEGGHANLTASLQCRITSHSSSPDTDAMAMGIEC